MRLVVPSMMLAAINAQYTDLLVHPGCKMVQFQTKGIPYIS